MTGSFADWLYLMATVFVGAVAIAIMIIESKNDRRCPFCGKKLEIDDVATTGGHTVCKACSLRNWRV